MQGSEALSKIPAAAFGPHEATIMLPMSLIAGIYGKNVPVWPAVDNPTTHWLVFLIMTLVGGLLAAYLSPKE